MYSVNNSKSKKPHQAHVIVCGNEKGGSGKTTTIMHLAVALLNAGYSVATIDLDMRQQSFSRYIGNRENYSRRHGLKLSLPNHYIVKKDFSDYVSDQENNELNNLLGIITKIQSSHDFILIDTPGYDAYLMRMAHSIADTLITPLNDSYVDFDVLGHIDPETGNVDELSHYARTVREARRQRRMVDNTLLDWIVVRNRLTQISSRNKESMYHSLQNLAMQIGCRLADGISERVIFRELFPKGLTALDNLETLIPSKKGTTSYLSARQEIRLLLKLLKLPNKALIDKPSKSLNGYKSPCSSKIPEDTLGL